MKKNYSQMTFSLDSYNMIYQEKITDGKEQMRSKRTTISDYHKRISETQIVLLEPIMPTTGFQNSVEEEPKSGKKRNSKKKKKRNVTGEKIDEVILFVRNGSKLLRKHTSS